MKYSDEIRLTLDLIILVLVLGNCMLFFLFHKRIEILKELIVNYIDSVNLREYLQAKVFITYHESHPGLSEYEAKRLESARKIVKAYENSYKAPKKN